MRYTTISEEVFDVRLHLIWNCGEEEATRKVLNIIGSVEDLDLEEEEQEFSEGKFIFIALVPVAKKLRPQVFYFLWVREALTAPRGISTASHEVTHLVEQICRTHGVPLTDDTEEFRAYYNGFWMKKLFQCFQSKKRK